MRAQSTPHAERLERWLGAEHVQNLSHNFRDWYGPPVGVAGVPGNVRVTRGGDFTGKILCGQELSGLERATEILREEGRLRFKRKFWHQRGSFSSLSALITAATSGNVCRMMLNMTGTAPTAILGCMDSWMYAGHPVAGSAGAALPGGTATTSSTTGAMLFVNAVVNANTSHFVNAFMQANFVNSLLLVDQLFRGAMNMTLTTAQSVTGTFSRYQNTTAGADDSIQGNFAYPAVTGTVLASVAHNWTVCQYTNQAGTTGQSMGSIAGISACAKNQIDLALGNWFMPLAAGDSGIKAMTQVQSSADVTSGTADIVVAHPIVAIPVPLVNIVVNIDGVASAFNLVKIFDNACLNLLELTKPATNATTYNGMIMTVSE